MRVNVYAEEMTNRLEIISKEIEGHKFTGLRFYLELPATVNGQQYQAPFIHHPGDDDSSAVTFWGKSDLRKILRNALNLLDAHYLKEERPAGSNSCNRHVDCAIAVQLWKEKHNGQAPGVNFHCHDDCCEDCFGC
jgi:hypothetical protein